MLFFVDNIMKLKNKFSIANCLILLKQTSIITFVLDAPENPVLITRYMMIRTIDEVEKSQKTPVLSFPRKRESRGTKVARNTGFPRSRE